MDGREYAVKKVYLSEKDLPNCLKVYNPLNGMKETTGLGGLILKFPLKGNETRFLHKIGVKGGESSGIITSSKCSWLPICVAGICNW